MWSDPAWWQAIASFLTLGAAGLAVWATFRAPRLAARFAEQLRVETQAELERRASKFNVFTILMTNRAAIASPASVMALNAIDVAFMDAPEVRAAWRRFHQSIIPENNLGHTTSERYLTIIERMAAHLGLSDQISIKDIETSYYPKSMSDADIAIMLETRHKIAQFQAPPALS